MTSVFLAADAPGGDLLDGGVSADRPPLPHTVPHRVVRLVVADPRVLVRAGVRALLAATAPDIDVVAECPDHGALTAVLDRQRPDVVVTSGALPTADGRPGTGFAGHLRARYPGLGVLVLVQRPGPGLLSPFFAGGTAGRGCLLIRGPEDAGALASAVRRVADGGTSVDPALVESLLPSSAPDPVGCLTPREREVLAEMAAGRNNASIARALSLTVRAVERHINAIFHKLGTETDGEDHRRVRAVLLFLAERQR